METKIQIDDLLMVAKRENNQKRSFLYVDPLQGKHVPVSPSRSLLVMKMLAKRVSEQYLNEALLVIGFSETATAIGTSIALSCRSVKAFLTTTREDSEGAEYIVFCESHSHATEQRLFVDGLEYWLKHTDRVLFAEDEVTTGNTIEKLMTSLHERFPEIQLRFGIASLLNSMTEERIDGFARRNIPCTYLAHVPFGYRIQDTELFRYESLQEGFFSPRSLAPECIKIRSLWNQRKVTGIDLIRNACDIFVREAMKRIPEMHSPLKLLVLGTEEFMYPGMLLGKTYEASGHTVRFHATTRSPIEVSADDRYPLHARFPLKSLYDRDRKTYVYDLKCYDKVIIVTDAAAPYPEGSLSLLGALEKCGNQDVLVIQWEETGV